MLPTFPHPPTFLNPASVTFGQVRLTALNDHEHIQVERACALIAPKNAAVAFGEPPSPPPQIETQANHTIQRPPPGHSVEMARPQPFVAVAVVRGQRLSSFSGLKMPYANAVWPVSDSLAASNGIAGPEQRGEA